ncbi:MAG: hypothetical protein MPJ24_01160 [Pirellulaceae bacterium]|nr:hypothetical protein [Pirellulaceae bacterium]
MTMTLSRQCRHASVMVMSIFVQGDFAIAKQKAKHNIRENPFFTMDKRRESPQSAS